MANAITWIIDLKNIISYRRIFFLCIKYHQDCFKKVNFFKKKVRDNYEIKKLINNILKFHLTTSFVCDNKFHIKFIDRFHKIDFIKLDESMIYLFFYFLLPIVQTGIKYFFFFHNSTTNIYIYIHVTKFKFITQILIQPNWIN